MTEKRSIQPTINEPSPLSLVKLMLDILFLSGKNLCLRLSVFRYRLSILRYKLLLHLCEVSVGFREFLSYLRGDDPW